MTPLIQRAADFAAQAHGSIDQRRKYTNAPYIDHPRAVAKLVEEAGGDEAMICAAWLHDVVEDTPVTGDEIDERFGADIGRLVWSLTDISRPEDGNRAARKLIDRQHVADASARAKAVKLADLINNTSTIVPLDPDFAVVYLKEKAALLEVLEDAAAVLPAAAILLARARQTLTEGQEALLQRYLAAKEQLKQ